MEGTLSLGQRRKAEKWVVREKPIPPPHSLLPYLHLQFCRLLLLLLRPGSEGDGDVVKVWARGKGGSLRFPGAAECKKGREKEGGREGESSPMAREGEKEAEGGLESSFKMSCIQGAEAAL